VPQEGRLKYGPQFYSILMTILKHLCNQEPILFIKSKNLHNCIAMAFRELKDLMDSGRTIPWKLKHGPDGLTWDVNLKFAFA
jgi:hypothetical protein